MEVKGKKGMEPFTHDEHPRDTTLEKLAKLAPVFKEDGCVSAGNASVSAVTVTLRPFQINYLLTDFQNTRSRSVGWYELKLNLVYYSMFSLKITSMDAVFKPAVFKESEMWTSLLHSFTKEGLLQLPG